jgi:hypothetical protein
MRRAECGIGALLAVLWVTPLGAQQPTGTIRGHVSDGATHQPLSGVTIAVGSHAALTQSDGRYVITRVPAGTDTLRTRMIGYASAKQAVTVVGGDTVVVDFPLSPQAVSLSEIVVTGYGEQRAGNITGAVKQVTAAEFNNGRLISPEQLIENKVAGVQLVDNNEPGGNLTIRIRGATSVNASSEPLYVVDGVPLGTGAGGGISIGRDSLNPGWAQSPELPESGRYREHHRAQGRLVRRDLWRERRQWRHPHPDENGAGRAEDRVYRERVRLVRDPAAVDTECRAVPCGRARARGSGANQSARQREHQLVRSGGPHRRRPAA